MSATVRAEPVTLSLREPVQAHGESVDSLTLRPPRGKDLREAGYPFIITGDGDTRTDAKAVGKLISLLAGVPTSTVDQLAFADWNAAFAAVSSFLGDGTAEKSSGSTSTQPGSGGTSPASSI